MARRRTRGRVRHHVRRLGRRLHRGVQKVSMKSRVVNTIALAIGLTPVISAAQTHLIGEQNAGNFIATLSDGYSAGLSSGQFNWQKAIQYYGPIVGAIAFKKLMSRLKVGKLII